MRESKSNFQLLGFDPNWICVVQDMLIYNSEGPFSLQVFPNIDLEFKAADRLKAVPFEVREMQEICRNQPVIFGVVSPRNKFPIYKDYSKFLREEDYNNVIAKSSIISASSCVGKAVFIDHQCVISAQTSVGFGVSIKRGAKIAHHNIIGDFSDINPGVITSGNVIIGKGCEIGTGAIVNNNVTIGDNTFIGMGSVVTKDIPANSVAFGNPCKVVRKNEMWCI